MRCTPRGGGGGTTTASFTWTIKLKGWGLYLYFNLKPLTEHVGHKWRDCGSSCDNTELTVSLGEKGRVCECVFCRGGVVADWHSGMDGGLFFWKRLLFQGKTKGPHRAPCSPDFTCYHLSALGLNKASLFPQVGWSLMIVNRGQLTVLEYCSIGTRDKWFKDEPGAQRQRDPVTL